MAEADLERSLFNLLVIVLILEMIPISIVFKIVAISLLWPLLTTLEVFLHLVPKALQFLSQLQVVEVEVAWEDI